MTGVSNISHGAAAVPATPSAAPQSPATPAVPAPPASDAASGAAALTAANAIGNQAAAAAPEAMKANIAQTGNRDLSIDALKTRAAYITNLLKMDSLPASFRAKLENDLATLKPVLQEQVAKDWLTNIAFASGARSGVVKTLDTATIYVVPTSKLASDAMYDEKANAIYISEKMVDDINKEVESLAQKQLIDIQRSIVRDPRVLRGTAEFHSLMVSQALIGVHEAGHMFDDQSGRNAVNALSLGDEVAAYRSAGGFGQTAAERTLIREYLKLFELPQYAAQERYQWEMGAAPQQSRWMTIDNHGRALAQEKALDNLYAFAMEAGSYSAQQAVDTYSAQSLTNGFKRPGEELNGFKRPGEELNGFKRPGEELA